MLLSFQSHCSIVCKVNIILHILCKVFGINMFKPNRGSCIIEFFKQVQGKDKMQGLCLASYRFPLTSLINSVIQEHKCKIQLIK